MLSGIENTAKGTATTIILNKTALFQLPSVLSNSYYSIQADVKKVTFFYKSVSSSNNPNEGRQSKEITFDLSQSSPTSTVFFSEFAKDQFELTKIVLSDFDGGFLKVNPTGIPAGLSISL